MWCNALSVFYNWKLKPSTAIPLKTHCCSPFPCDTTLEHAGEILVGYYLVPQFENVYGKFVPRLLTMIVSFSAKFVKTRCILIQKRK